MRIQSLESIAHLCAKNSFNPNPHRSVNNLLYATLHGVGTPLRGGLNQALGPMAEPIVIQRIRNRIIDYLELASSFDEQSAYQEAAPHINVPNEVINQWEDWISPDWSNYIIPPVFSPDEIIAIGQFYDVWNAVAAATPDPLPPLQKLLDTVEWQRLASAAAEFLTVLNVRGRLPEHQDGPDPGMDA